MADAADIAAIVDAAAAGPAEAENDGQRVKSQPLPDLLEWQRQSAASAGMANRNRGLRFTRIIPPDTAT